MKTRFLLLLLALSSTPAAAHWQYTRWGMTVEEVSKAAPLPIAIQDEPDLSSPGSQVKAGAVYEASGMKFTAAFAFDRNQKLNRVTLYPRDKTRCAELGQMLRSVYGEPSQDGTRSNVIYNLTTWRDEAEGNTIQFLWIGSERCSVDYEPIRSTKQTGL